MELRSLFSKKYVNLFLDGDGDRSLGERLLFHTAKNYEQNCNCEIPQGDPIDRVIFALENGWHRVDIEDFDVLLAMKSRSKSEI